MKLVSDMGKKEQCMKLTFIRHGKTQGNLESRYVGRTDQPLCAEGCEELLTRKAAGEYPAAPLIVFVSPLLRCRESASIIFPSALQIPVAEFTECDFGEFEMKNYEELDGNPVYQAWIESGGTAPFPNGESMSQMKARALRGFYRVMEQTGGNDACFVVHGGTIMAILSQIAGGDFYDYQVENGECIIYETAPSAEV